MNTLAAIIIAVLRLLVPAVVDYYKPKYKQADNQSTVKAALARKIRQSWPVVLLLLFMITITGCVNTRTIYVPDGTPVKLRETVKNVKVWIMVDGRQQPSTMNIPAGWYCVALDEDQ
ncbi:MAG: hypothetical protein JEZ07_08970 [Phycisphaerae bacterium]|nr:hypothetical protein [Phycisphaerae bacterium]